MLDPTILRLAGFNVLDVFPSINSITGDNMNVLTYFEELGGWLKSHFKKMPSYEVQLSSAVNYLAPFVEELDSLADPQVAVLVNPIIERIKTGLAALAVTIKQSGPSGHVSVNAILTSIAGNATALESTFAVKDQATQQRITAILQLLQGELAAMQAQFAPVPVPTLPELAPRASEVPVV